MRQLPIAKALSTSTMSVCQLSQSPIRRNNTRLNNNNIYNTRTGCRSPTHGHLIVTESNSPQQHTIKCVGDVSALSACIQHKHCRGFSFHARCTMRKNLVPADGRTLNGRPWDARETLFVALPRLCSTS